MLTYWHDSGLKSDVLAGKRMTCPYRYCLPAYDGGLLGGSPGHNLGPAVF